MVLEIRDTINFEIIYEGYADFDQLFTHNSKALQM
jgi:hypothetical protein